MILNVAPITVVELWEGFCMSVAIFGSTMKALMKRFFFLLPCITPNRINVCVSKLPNGRGAAVWVRCVV